MLTGVDDTIIAANGDHVLCDVKELLKSRFRTTDYGQLKWFLGIQFIHGDGIIRMNQKRYLTMLLQKYYMEHPVNQSRIQTLKKCQIFVQITGRLLEV
jgi:hypothetical protein